MVAMLTVLIPILSPANPQELSESWWEAVTEELTYQATSDDGKAVLDVELVKPEENKLVEIKDNDQVTVGYSIEGKRLPEGYWPGRTLIKKFHLVWDGREITIPQRFWDDLPGFRIQRSPLVMESLPPGQQHAAFEFLARLEQPRLIVSADGGTLLIEWTRPEECDARSTIRWIIGRSGTILRHRHSPPDGC